MAQLYFLTHRTTRATFASDTLRRTQDGALASVIPSPAGGWQQVVSQLSHRTSLMPPSVSHRAPWPHRRCAYYQGHGTLSVSPGDGLSIRCSQASSQVPLAHQRSFLAKLLSPNCQFPRARKGTASHSRKKESQSFVSNSPYSDVAICSNTVPSQQPFQLAPCVVSRHRVSVVLSSAATASIVICDRTIWKNMGQRTRRLLHSSLMMRCQ